MFAPSGVVTLTTDFGHKGPFVGAMKGVILARHPAARIIDITHETDVHFPAEAGFWLRRSFPYFPSGTVHIAVVDPGVGTGRDIIVVVHEGHAFVAPDNGLLAPLAQAPQAVVHRLELPRVPSIDPTQISATFHGRDIFAPVGAEIAAGNLRPEDVGPPIDQVVPSWLDEPQVTSDTIRGSVIAVDNFGNLISNIEAELVAPRPPQRVRAGGRTIPFLRTYGDVQPGDFLALVNSLGVVEIARAERSAAEALGLERGAPVIIEFE
ncbi:MAG: SAM-dependent chlorinase/fluorinase [Myxococcota bacterium]